MLPFLESPRFNTEIRYGTTGGITFSTDISTKRSGHENRNGNWYDGKGKWDLGSDVYNKLEIEALTAVFRERQGSLGAFRFKDWSDWRATVTQGKLAVEMAEDLTLRVQMVKEYSWGGESVQRRITKPVPGTITFYDSDGNVVPDVIVDFTSGAVTMPVMDITLHWSGEFDVPARFGQDKFDVQFEGYDRGSGESLYTISGLSIFEVIA